MFDYFLQRSIKSGFKKYHRESSFMNFDDMKDIVIFFDMENREEIIPVIEDLKRNGKNVHAWTMKSGGSSLKSGGDIRVIEPEKDLSLLRSLKPEVLEEFDKLYYDTLIDFSSSDNNYFLLLLSRNKSRFCIGIIEREYKIYDFILLKEEGYSLSDSYDQLKIYLKQIQ